tara:strand:- start:1 stop:198 length:198 start_codon:yes stop_codon:yes gene_type:complete
LLPYCGRIKSREIVENLQTKTDYPFPLDQFTHTLFKVDTESIDIIFILNSDRLLALTKAWKQTTL